MTKDNHYGGLDSADFQSEDQSHWATRSDSINEFADVETLSKGIDRLRVAAKAQGRLPCFSPWEDSGQ